MSTAPLQIDGIQIANSAELLRFLDLDQDSITPSPKTQESITRQGTTKITDPPRMFALLIGINEYDYDEIPNLRGAVSDAQAIGNYLKNNLGVNESGIRMLLGRDATRRGIIDALIALRDDDNIQRGEAILIYYAGHGQDVEAPEGWATENDKDVIQSIVPQDFDDQDVHVIPDRTFGFLIDDIMHKRGDNITVILDCCYSGSGTRKDEMNRMARTALLENYTIPPGLDKDLGPESHATRSTSASNGFSATGLSSHILLAACGATQLAREVDGRGQFTRSLENALKDVSPDQITYVQLLERLQNISGQDPQLEGNNRHRIVFDSRAAPRVHNSYILRLDKGAYILHAGGADGVCPDAEFTLYADHEGLLKDPSLGVMVPADIYPFRTVMRPLSEPGPPLERPALAVQTRAGLQQELKIFIPLEEPLIPVFEAALMQMKTVGYDRHGITIVDDRSAAHLAVERDGDLITFLILDERVTVHGLTKCIYKVKANAEDLRPVLQGAAHYQYHLNRSCLNSANIDESVTMEFFKLKVSGQVDEVTRRPLRCPSGENLLKDGIISLNISDSLDEVFGIRITNNWTKDLYPTLFYFDNSELSVTQYYGSAGPSKFGVDSPLPKNGGRLNLGFGNGGVKPYEYFIPKGQEVDVGFLKCFFSTSPVDLSKVAQMPPFKLGRGVRPSDSKVSDAWGCILVPVVQRRVK